MSPTRRLIAIPLFCGLFVTSGWGQLTKPSEWFKPKPTTLAAPQTTPLPPPNMPEARMPTPKLPQFHLPSFGASKTAEGPGVVDRWNDSMGSMVEKTKQALTLPKLSPPPMPALPDLPTPQVTANESFLSRLPFSKSKKKSASAPRSLVPSWLRPAPPEPQQPPTVHEWLGQPRPQ